MMPGPLPLLRDRVLDVAEEEDERPRLAGREFDVERVRGDRLPTARNRIAGLPTKGDLRLVHSVVEADERLSVGIEARDGGVHMIKSEVIAPLAVFRLVINGAVDDFDFAGAEVALVVRHVVVGVPQAKFDVRKELDGLRRFAAIGHGHAVHLGRVPQRNEERLLDADALSLAGNLRVAQAVAALVEIELALDGHVRGRPRVTSVVDVEVAAADVGRRVVVPIARQAAQARVAVKAVATRLMRDQTKEVLAAEVVDPRIRSTRCRDDVFAAGIVEVTESHELLLQHGLARKSAASREECKPGAEATPKRRGSSPKAAAAHGLYGGGSV
jgi:hypothetical protein